MSKSIFAVVALCLCIVALGNAQVVSRASQLFQRRAPVPKALTGITDCGVGELVDIRLSGCSQAPCTLSVGESYTLEADFKSRDMHWILRYGMIAHHETELITIAPEEAVADSTVQAGELYTFTYQFTAQQSLSQRGDIRLELHENWIQELCLIIPVNIV